MLIDFGKLENMGFEVDFNKVKKTVSFHARFENDMAHTQTRKLADLLEFTDTESDELVSHVHHMQCFHCLRKASGW